MIDKDRLVGWLSPTELRGYLILNNNIDKTFSIYKDIYDLGYQITADITEVKTEILFRFVSDEEIHATVKVKAKGFLTEIQGEAPQYDDALYNKIENILANEIASELSSVVKRAQDDLRTDFTGFHKSFSIKYPKQWEDFKGNWCEIFCRIPVSYDVDLKIRHRGLMSRNFYD